MHLVYRPDIYARTPSGHARRHETHQSKSSSDMRIADFHHHINQPQHNTTTVSANFSKVGLELHLIYHFDFHAKTPSGHARRHQQSQTSSAMRMSHVTTTSADHNTTTLLVNILKFEPELYLVYGFNFYAETPSGHAIRQEIHQQYEACSDVRICNLTTPTMTTRTLSLMRSGKEVDCHLLPLSLSRIVSQKAFECRS